MISETSINGSTRNTAKAPFVPSQRLENHFLALARQVETWRGDAAETPTVGIAGIRSGIGTSTVAFNLAACLASSRSLNACVLECHFGHPFVSRRIAASLPGLSDALSGNMEIQSCLHPAGPEGLTLVGPGTLGVAAASRLVSPAFGNVLKEVQSQFDWVICDLPVASPLTSCFDLAANLDGVILVTGTRDGADAPAREIAQQFRNLGIDLIGLVQNDV